MGEIDVLSSCVQRKYINSRVLLIDDQVFILHALKNQLKIVGIDCEVVTSGENAITLLQALFNEKQALFDVILTDFSMPEKDGA